MSGCLPVGKVIVAPLPSLSPLGVSPTPVQLYSNLSFGGITSVSAIEATSLTLNWTNVVGAASYAVYNTTSGMPSYLGAVLAPNHSYTVNGLHIATQYTFRVDMIDTTGRVAPSPHDTAVETSDTNTVPGITYTSPNANYALGSAITPDTALATGGTATGFSVSPNLPAGLHLDATSGQITGTPTRLTSPATYLISATINAQSVSTSLGLSVNFAGITSVTEVTGSSMQLNWAPAAGAQPPAASYLVIDTSSGSIVQTVSAPAANCVVSGLAAGTTYTYEVHMVDTTGVIDQNTVSQSATTLIPAPPANLTYTVPSATYTLGLPIVTNSPSSSGGAVSSYSVSPSLPTGLSFDSSTGQITGSPTQLVNPSRYTVSAVNSGGSTTTTLQITVNFAGITSITQVTGSSLQLNWALPTNAQPASAGFEIFEVSPTRQLLETVSATSSSVVIESLNPAATYSFQIQMIDTSGTIDLNTVTQSATTLSTAPPRNLNYSTPTPRYVLGNAIATNSPSVSGGAVSAYSITPALPAGLSLDSTSGQITGTPTQLANSVPYTITASNAGGYTSTTLNLAVNFAGITSITNVTGVSMQLNWVLAPGATPPAGSFEIFETSPTQQLVQTASGTSTSASVSNLSPATTYSYRVVMIDTAGTTDQNTVTQTATTNSTVPPANLTYTVTNPTYVLDSAITTNSPSFSGGSVSNYTISPALPLGLAFNTTTGQITGTPTQLALTAPYTVTAINAGGSTTTTLTLGVNFAGITSITQITGSSLQLNWTLPSQASPAAGGFEIFETAPTAQYILTTSGSSSSVVLSQLTAATSYTYTVRMVDTSGTADANTVTQSATTLSTAPPNNLTYAHSPAIYTLGVAISPNNPSSSGGTPSNYTISPSLPPGLALSASTGQISGTPSALSRTAPYTVTASNAGGSTTTTFNLTVNFAGISSISNVLGASLQLNWALPSGASPGPGSFEILETAPTNQLVETVSGSSTNAVISGLTPSTAYTFEVRMVDISGTTDQNTVTQTATTLSTAPPTGLIYATPSPSYVLETAIAANTPSSSGGAVSSYTINPSLPPGLSLNTGTGAITGTPSALALETNYTVTATNSGGSATTTLNLAVNFSGISSITNVTGSSLRLNWVTPTGASPAAASYNIYNSTSFPPIFLESVSAPATSMVITGLTANTTYKFRVHLVDTSGSSDANTVDATATTNTTTPPNSLSYSSPTPTYVLGTAITTNTPTHSGGAVSTYSISPTLPGGLTFSSTSGQITGTPTQLATSAPYTVTASNAGGASTATLNLTVNFAGITSISNITGNSLQVNWANPAGALPPAASFNVIDTGSNSIVATVDAPATSAMIAGLSVGSSHTYEVHMTDTSGLTDQNTVTQTATTLSTTPPSNLSYSQPTPSYTLGTAISPNNPSSSGGSVSSYSINPSLPAGLILNPSSGQITGTPTQLLAPTTYTVTASNAGGSTSAPLNVVINYAGIYSVTPVGPTLLQVNWTLPSNANPGPSNFLIYNAATTPPTFLGSAGANATSYGLTGLTSNTTYQYLVRMTDTSGVTDANTVSLSTTTPTVSATFQGWSNVTALGPSIPVPQATDLSPVTANLTLSWNPVASSGSVSSYTLYRGTQSGAESYGVPLATGISASNPSYTDSTILSGTTYYYTVAPVIAGVTTELNPGLDNEIVITTPPPNMALIHKWIANQEICGLMGRAIDRSHDYRCSYTGPGNVNGYYNNTQSYFVDVNPMGCSYSQAPACGGADCIGNNGTPAGSLGTSGNIYYDRGSQTCYVNTGGTWSPLNTSGEYSIGVSNAPGLPPFVSVNQTQAWSFCQGISVGGYNSAKRLLRLREQIVAAAWSPNLTDAQISNLENGQNLYSTFACNSNNGSGLSYSSANIPPDLNTLPSTGGGGVNSVRNGSTATTNCISRYGVRDMAGNIYEWRSDQFGTCSINPAICTGIASTLDTANTDLNGFNFDGTIGPGGGSSSLISGVLSSGSIYDSYSFNNLQVPLGLPMVGSAPTTWDSVVIGSNAGQFNPSHFHGNSIIIVNANPNDSPVARGVIGGGAWSNGNQVGRFNTALAYPPSGGGTNTGFRCMLTMD